MCAEPARRARSRASSIVRASDRLQAREDGSLRLAIVSDSHSVLHARALAVLAELHPDAILHAGDIGDVRVLDDLASVSPVLAVRGNVDARLPGLPDSRTVDIVAGDRALVRILLLHIGLHGPRLRAEAARLARSEGASMVVCGHSHVPFIGLDRGLTVFNPGSIGPPRWPLPVVLGVIDVSAAGIQMSHVDCTTGQRWSPP